MTVKNVIILVGRLLGLEKELELYFLGDENASTKTIDQLLDCYYRVETELAVDSFPLETEDVYCSHGEILFDDLECVPLRILSVTDEKGNTADAQITPMSIRVADGQYTIRYTYQPKRKTEGDDVEFPAFVTENLLAYGVAAEYCLQAGLYEESALWKEKFEKAVRAVKPLTRGGALRARSWN